MSAVEAIGYGNPDTLKAMLLYYILCSTANCHAASWWEGSYARILFPNADLRSQRISDFLMAIGDEYSQREFFGKYLSLLGAKEKAGQHPHRQHRAAQQRPLSACRHLQPQRRNQQRGAAHIRHPPSNRSAYLFPPLPWKRDRRDDPGQDHQGTSADGGEHEVLRHGRRIL